MRSIVFILLPPDTSDPVGKTKELIAPYDLNLEFPPYKHYFSEEYVKGWIAKYKRDDLHYIAQQLTEGVGWEFGVDEKGLYEITTFNHQGRWDYWSPQNCFDEDDSWAIANIERWGELAASIFPIEMWQEKSWDWLSPFSIVTPDGRWHSLMRDFGYKPIYEYEGYSGYRKLNEEPRAKWRSHVENLLQRYPGYVVFALDAHC